MKRALAVIMCLIPALAMAQDPPPEHPANNIRPEPRPAQPAQPEPAPATAPEVEPAAAPEVEPAPVTEVAAPPTPLIREDDFSYSACLLELTLLGADYSEVAPVHEAEQPECGIARPIMLREPLPGIQITGGALMRCDTARHLAHWLRDFVRPAAALLPGQPKLVGIDPGSTYQCRATIGNNSEKLSEHALGSAFDIAAFRFQDGSTVAITDRQDKGDMTEAFQRAVRGAACLHFTTVLGPGSNAAHGDHLHVDIKARKGGYRLCQ